MGVLNPTNILLLPIHFHDLLLDRAFVSASSDLKSQAVYSVGRASECSQVLVLYAALINHTYAAYHNRA